VIGQSIQIDGTLTGNEDLTIDGKINGKIKLRGHMLTIGPNGRIEAALRAKTVVIQGEVTGNVTADDKIQISASGSVIGDISAPRIALDDGARFKGSVDMGEAPAEPVATTKPVSTDMPAKPRYAG
jgi:cytoskeletal protein CcmA (bactofilin family)